MKGRSLQQRLHGAPGAAESVAESGGPTSSLAAVFEDKQLISCCQDSVVVSVLLLSDETNHRLCKIMHTVTSKVSAWHGRQNKMLRCGDACEAWLVEQSAGGYVAHVCEVMSCMRSFADLEKAGFVLDSAGAQVLGEGEALSEGDFADIAMMRIRRGAWLTTGWPWSMSAFLDGAAKDATVARFEQDRSVFEALQVVIRVWVWEGVRGAPY